MRLFSKLACLTIVSCFACMSVWAQPEALIQTGLQPLAFVSSDAELHVFCNRIDLNFNGAQDEGDSPASWWVIDQASQTASQRLAFDWDDGFGFPFRPAADPANDLLFLPLSEEVRTYKLSTGEVVFTAPEMPYGASAAYYDATTGEVLISQRQMGANDVLRTFNLETGNTETFEVGDNIQQALVWTDADSQRHILVLCEGIFGEDNSVLTVLTPGADPIRRDITLGATGNHLLLQNDFLYVTMNAGHQIHEIDLKQLSIVRSFDVGTTEFNGPRDAVIVDGDIYVTTYAEDVRRISLQDGTLKAILTTGAKPEGIAYRDGRLWVTNAFESASFASDRTVAVLHPKLSTEIVAIVPTVPQPAHLATTPEGVIAFGNQIDLNFDGRQDEGDMPQSVALHSEVDFSSEWRSPLPWGRVGFPLRPALNPADNQAYILTGRQLVAQSTVAPTNQTLDNVNLGNAIAVSYSSDENTLAVTERGDATGIVRLIDLSDGFEESVVTGLSSFVQQTLWSGNIAEDFDLIVLDEGDFNGGAGRLVFVNHETAGIVSTLELGAGANHMLLDGNLIYVTINGAHEVVAVDLTKKEIVERIPTGTEGFNGPRESIVFDGDLFVTTYSNDVRRFDLVSGEMVDRYETGGKPESLTAFDGRIWVANAFEFNSFSSGNTLAVIEPSAVPTSVHELTQPNAVNSRKPLLKLTLSPNPAAQNVQVAMSAEILCGQQLRGSAQLELVTLDGQIVHRQFVEMAHLLGGAEQINIDGLAGGVYVVTLQSGESLYSARLIIQP
jgi:hypothetical protein